MTYSRQDVAIRGRLASGIANLRQQTDELNRAISSVSGTRGVTWRLEDEIGACARSCAPSRDPPANHFDAPLGSGSGGRFRVQADTGLERRQAMAGQPH